MFLSAGANISARREAKAGAVLLLLSHQLLPTGHLQLWPTTERLDSLPTPQLDPCYLILLPVSVFLYLVDWYSSLIQQLTHKGRA